MAFIKKIYNNVDTLVEEVQEGQRLLYPDAAPILTLEGGTRVIARPSGTEPKLKLYVLACGATKELAAKENEELSEALKKAME